MIDGHGLVISVRAGLEAAGTLESIDGQLALQLARRLANPEESGISSLSKELRTVLASALESTKLLPLPSTGPVAETVVDDEVTRARTARAQARQAARRS